MFVFVVVAAVAGAGALGGRELAVELGRELLKLGAKGGDLARRGAVNLVAFLSRQPRMLRDGMERLLFTCSAMASALSLIASVIIARWMRLCPSLYLY